MIEFVYSRVALKFLDKHEGLKDKAQSAIIGFIKGENADIKRLKGTNNPKLLRLRLGKYRIIFFINDSGDLVIVNIIAANSRGDIY